MMKGNLFLIPTHLDSKTSSDFIAPAVGSLIQHLDYFLVENIKSARRFISSLKLGIDISTLNFKVLNKKSTGDEITRLCFPLITGEDIGVMSEVGLPGLADPGNLAVSFAHQNNICVVPLPGSSSIQMALIASGFNGQKFTFHGYLPIHKTDLFKKLKELETTVRKTDYTQVFMEAPFRNNQLLEALFQTLHENTMLSVAAGISGENEFIKTMAVRDWKKAKIDIHKIPAIFSLGTFPK